MTKKCEGSKKQLVECKLFEKCKGAAEQQLVECNLFNHLPATSCQSSHNQLGGGGGVLKVQPAYSFRLNSHSQPAFSCLAASSNSLPSQNNQFSFCIHLFPPTRASTWALLGMPRCRNIAIVKTTLNPPPLSYATSYTPVLHNYLLQPSSLFL